MDWLVVMWTTPNGWSEMTHMDLAGRGQPVDNGQVMRVVEQTHADARRATIWNEVMTLNNRLALLPLVVGALSVTLAGCGPVQLNRAPVSGNRPQVYATGSGGLSANQSASALPGDLLIADEGNRRLLIVTPNHKIVWSLELSRYPGFAGGADDAFLTPDRKHIIINEESNQVIAIIDMATKKMVWHYGHAGVAGSLPGYLNTPDDAYQWPNGTVSVADIRNQRILFIDPKTNRIIKQYGITGDRYHNPPRSFAAPNGDTPVRGGRMLVTEIGGSFADMMSPTGRRLFTVHFPDILYPSDTQELPNGNLLVVDYSQPGRIEEITPKGTVVWDYYRTSGPGMLNHPSLAIALPNGEIALNDDYNDRVIIIDPRTNKILWQYGHTGQEGSRAGFLREPDGIDFLSPAVVARALSTNH